jgi:hypothetical protein
VPVKNDHEKMCVLVKDHDEKMMTADDSVVLVRVIDPYVVLRNV